MPVRFWALVAAFVTSIEVPLVAVPSLVRYHPAVVLKVTEVKFEQP